ncbi:MAG: protein translocase subunit SecF [Chloroflexi bacterium]|nr:protein translocase subunit SecF [Chloroflexota bacterium]
MRRIDLVSIRPRFFLGSGFLLVVSLALLLYPGLRPGIEFTAGTTTLIRFDDPVQQDALRSVYTSLGRTEALIQSTGSNEYLIRTGELEIPEGSFTEVSPSGGPEFDGIGPSPLEEIGTVILGADEEATDEVGLYLPLNGDACTPGETVTSLPAGTEVSVIEQLLVCPSVVYRVIVDGQVAYLSSLDTHDFREPGVLTDSPVTEGAGERTIIEQRLFDEFGQFDVLEFASVSAVVSTVAVRNAAVAVAIASLFIMAYVWFAFASVPRANRYAACAIAALIHDVVIVLGAFALFGVLFGTEVNLMFVTGLLTVIGFSVHDTIVTFDRIRENVRSLPNAPLAENVNAALLQTMARSFNTTLTLLLTVTAMLFLGGVTIREFLLVILVGLIAGVYSSIGIAAQLLVAWEAGDFRRFARRRAAA